LGRIGLKFQEVGENCIMRNFIICSFLNGSTARSLGLAAFSVSWSYTQLVGLLERGPGDQPVARSVPTHRKTNTNKHAETSMTLVGFEPTTPALDLAKKVHTLDRRATVIG
jgi:hypothetical protein